MAGNKESGDRSAKTQNERAKARLKETGDAAVGKGSGPYFGTGAWAKEHGLWEEGDTEGPAKK